MIPIENLEQRIKEIEDEIIERLKINQTILTELEHQRKKIEEGIKRLGYNSYSPGFFSTRIALESQMLNIEQSKFHEQLTCFRDIVILKKVKIC